MTRRTLISSSELETAKIAQLVATRVSSMDAVGQPILIGLEGDLGAGKSVFARSFIRSLMGDCDLAVPSPTFTLVQYYDAPDFTIYHYDLYRLKDAEEVYEIGWEESLSSGVSLVEWPQRLMGMKPSQMLDISIATADNGVDRMLTLPDSLLS